MKKRMMIAAFGGMVLLSGILFAGIRQDMSPPRQRIRENIHTLRLLKMTEALDLTDQQAAKIFPALGRIEKEKAEIQKTIFSDIRNLRALLAAPTPDEKAIDTLLGTVKGLREELRKKDDEFEGVLENSLTLVQKAKYQIFSMDFYRGLGEKLRRAGSLREKRNS